MSVDIKYIKIDNMEIFGPINKVHNYCYLAENIFSVKEISFCKEKDLHKKKISNLFIDPTYIKKFLNSGDLKIHEGDRPEGRRSFRPISDHQS